MVLCCTVFQEETDTTAQICDTRTRDPNCDRLDHPVTREFLGPGHVLEDGGQPLMRCSSPTATPPHQWYEQ